MRSTATHTAIQFICPLLAMRRKCLKKKEFPVYIKDSGLMGFPQRLPVWIFDVMATPFVKLGLPQTMKIGIEIPTSESGSTILLLVNRPFLWGGTTLRCYFILLARRDEAYVTLLD